VLPRETSIASHAKNNIAARAAITLILYSAMERIPFQATAAGAPYEQMGRLPVSILLDNVRSLYNVGAFFRTADAAAIEKLYLCGITGRPPKRAITKTALGAEETVPWEHAKEAGPLAESLRAREMEIAAIETTVHAVDLFDWSPRFPVCLIFGHEVDGIQPELSALCDTHIRIPMLGAKHSLNVATAGGVAIYELLRKYRALAAIR
jgi:tRNA G18 (ribose-2'-O)-methylase SpoU